MTTLQGKPVDSMDAVWDGEPGSYYVIRKDGEITGLWFKLPTGGLGRIAAVGHHPDRDADHEWTITADENGVVTVDPSILQHEMPNVAEHPENAGWHGHLRNGVWEW